MLPPARVGTQTTARWITTTAAELRWPWGRAVILERKSNDHSDHGGDGLPTGGSILTGQDPRHLGPRGLADGHIELDRLPSRFDRIRRRPAGSRCYPYPAPHARPRLA